MGHAFRILTSQLYFLMLDRCRHCVFHSEAINLRLWRLWASMVCEVPALFLQIFFVFFIHSFIVEIQTFPSTSSAAYERKHALYLQHEDGAGNHSRRRDCKTWAPSQLTVSGTVKQSIRKKKKKKTKSGPHVTEQHIFPPAG